MILNTNKENIINDTEIVHLSDLYIEVSTTKYSTLFGKLSELLNGIHKKRLCMFLITV